ncbi:3-hydroxyisobutyryl-CoA hydrolase [Candidatus Rhodobacter oscarellae]|uniref:3-hydroxyisobutyryl-CoA hydrolase n=1 Tax=Candidatus Rhodobacter oscarellae TaxID=1675527 RepID=A0A0J9GT92_9RHOB|nr:enoyl-CoA hydratase/isomerase family protein [Candidatus Rhodobacter lobularis]KMW56703.1 3-hydroxyisobutyryl-CoA hydrolase [Candidatus Rhodobacter lobularis]
MSDIWVRQEGRAGRITLQRPEALNAATYDMLRAIKAAVDGWAEDDSMELVILDAEGERAFCSGGDIADLYAAGRAGDFAFGRQFWADEYRLNAKLAEYPKPIYAFLQGFTMGGGVGLGCHARHRIVGDTSQIAMPECGIGLVPDVGGSLLLAQAPGRLGEYLGLTGARMGAGDAIYCGFADHYAPETDWEALKASLIATGALPDLTDAPAAPLAAAQAELDGFFARETLGDIITALDSTDSPATDPARKALLRNSPLSMAAALHVIRRVRAARTIRDALREEYRFTWRASEQGDFLEGIRAAIIDKDRRPKWRHGPMSVTQEDALAMLAPLGENELKLEG